MLASSVPIIQSLVTYKSSRVNAVQGNMLLQVIKGYIKGYKSSRVTCCSREHAVTSHVTYKSSRVTCCSTSFKVTWLTSHQGLHAVQHHSKSRDLQVIKGYMLFNFFNEGLFDLNCYHLYSKLRHQGCQISLRLSGWSMAVSCSK